MSHSVLKVSNNLNSILSSNKKKLGFLFGAGSSINLGDDLKLYSIPGIKEITQRIVDEIKEDYANTIKSIKENDGDVFNIESLLTNINMRIEVIGKGTIDNLNKQQLIALRDSIVDQIKDILVKHLDIHEKQLDHFLPHVKFANWLKNTKRDFGIEIFTTNYDMLIEMALENSKVKFVDGFFGSLHPFFDSTYISKISKDENVKLWKIHGSLGWSESHNGIIRSMKTKSLMILPSILKYKDSRKEPYTCLLDRLSYFIKSDDCVLITSGYSFQDQHINEIILDALKTNTNSLVVGLLYDKLPSGESLLENSNSLKKMCIENNRFWLLGNKSAYIDGQYGEYEYDNISKDNLDLTEYLFESIFVQSKNEKKVDEEKQKIKAILKIVDSPQLFRYLESMRLEISKDE